MAMYKMFDIWNTKQAIGVLVKCFECQMFCPFFWKPVFLSTSYTNDFIFIFVSTNTWLSPKRRKTKFRKSSKLNFLSIYEFLNI